MSVCFIYFTCIYLFIYLYVVLTPNSRYVFRVGKSLNNHSFIYLFIYYLICIVIIVVFIVFCFCFCLGSACPLASQPGITTTVESEPGLESTSKPETESPPINYRLPSALKPVHYDVELKPYIYGNDSSNFQINGSVSINIHVIKNTNNITIHSHWLNVTKSSVSLVSDQPVTPTVTNITVVNTTQFLVFSLDGPLLKGSNVTLSINFTSRLRTDMFGFYSSSYVTDNNETM